MSWALHVPELSPVRKLVLVAIADHANRDGVAWPSAATIAATLGLSRSTVWRHTAALAAAGLLVKDAQQHREDGTLGVVVYRLPVAVEKSVDRVAELRDSSRVAELRDDRVATDRESPGHRVAQLARSGIVRTEPNYARARAREDRDPARRNGAVDSRGSSGTARPPGSACDVPGCDGWETVTQADHSATVQPCAHRAWNGTGGARTRKDLE